MHFLKKVFVVFLALLFVRSLLYDWSTGVLEFDVTPTNTEEDQKEKNNHGNKASFQAVPYQVQSGDTVLSILEQLNPHLNMYSMEKVIEDFQSLNPGIDPHSILNGNTYLFPVYDEQ